MEPDTALPQDWTTSMAVPQPAVSQANETFWEYLSPFSNVELRRLPSYYSPGSGNYLDSFLNFTAH